MDLKKIRERSLLTAKSLGYEINSDLPILDEGLTLRSVDDLVGRSLALFAVVAGSYGFDKKSAITWLEKERAFSYLAESEKSFLVDHEGDSSYFQSQVEGLNAFAWSLNIVKQLEFDHVCENNLIKLFPDIKNNGDSSAYRAKSKSRSLEKITQVCLHWAIIQAQLEGKKLPGDVGPHVITERRRALEWMLSKEDWDELSLDT
jgi:Domain of unknown function (DUF4272)